MQIRNVAVIAHVDHGKTTLTDQLLYQSGSFRKEDLDKLAGGQHGLVMDSGDIERERGITITSKNCSAIWTPRDGSEPIKMNLIDTPGHADFGAEVERVLNMADGCLLVVDAFEGPMPQTRFVLEKALRIGLKPVVVINKIDKPTARPDDVINEVFDLLASLDAPDEVMDFPVVYACAKQGWATTDEAAALRGEHDGHIDAVYEVIRDHIPAPYTPGSGRAAAAGYDNRDAALADDFQMLVTSFAWSEYVGRIAIGRVTAGKVVPGQRVSVIQRDGKVVAQKVQKVEQFDRLGRVDVDEATAGDICALTGLDPIELGDTVAHIDNPRQLPPVPIDEPTLTMTFRVNDSPFCGKEGQYVTSRQVFDRLQKELQSNVALRIERSDSGEAFQVSGRGLMHLGVLIETMRREGYEVQVGPPRVILRRDEDGTLTEPIENVVLDCPEEKQNDVMGLVMNRQAEIVTMEQKGGSGWSHIELRMPSRALIGLRGKILTATAGEVVYHHTLDQYEPMRGDVPGRPQGVMIAMETGQVTAYSLDRLYDRGVFFVKPGDTIYEGQVVGEHCKETDIPVNLVINKKHTNVRSAGSDDATRVRPARELSLEDALAYIQEDELVEITPESMRLRKVLLKEADRRRDKRAAKG